MKKTIEETTRLLLNGTLLKEDADKILLNICNVSGWVVYDWNKPETRPKEYGKYFVHRKDGKVHWETWNGSGWAYNGNVITYWKEIKPPCH
jgi:hypothetical protein